jgi:hypothetical protein
LDLEREALEFCKMENDVHLGKVCSKLSLFILDRLHLEWEKKVRLKMFNEALTYGEKAIAVLSELGEEHELARAYNTTSIHYYNGASGLELQKKKQYLAKAYSYAERAVQLSEELDDYFLMGLSNLSLEQPSLLFLNNQVLH